MSKFFSIPGLTHSGDRPRYIKRDVKGADGEVLFQRDVLEEGYDPGFDSGDGLHFNGAPMEKVNVDFNRQRQTTAVTYRYKEDGANRWHTRVVEYDRQTDNGDVVLARDRHG